MPGDAGAQGGGHGGGRCVQEFRAARAITQELHRVGGGDDQVGHVGGIPQDFHQSLPHHALIAQHAKEPLAVIRGVGKLAVVEQTGIGIGSLGKPFHEGGQQHRLDTGFAGGPRGQGDQVLVGAVRVVVAQRSELAFCRFGGKTQRFHRQVDHGVQQWPEEELGVQLRDLAADFAVFAGQCFCGGAVANTHDPGGAGQPAETGFVVLGGHGVGAADALQLQAMLQESEEFVGVYQGGAVFATDIPCSDEGVQCGNGGAHAEGFVAAPMHHLQQLHRKFHVAEGAAPEFQFTFQQFSGHVINHASAH